MNPSIKDEEFNNIEINSVSDLLDFISDYKSKTIPVKIEIFQSASDSFYIIKEYSAQGKNEKDAIQYATSFKHSISQINNKILIDPYIQFDNENVKFRNQKLHIRIYVPEGKVIKWDKRTEEYMNMKNIAINWDDVQYPMPPMPPVPPMPGKQNHKIEIKTSKNGDSASSKISINIDSDNEDLNDALDKAQEKIDEAREKIEAAQDEENNIEINIDGDNDNRLYRQHYIFKMVNGELVPID
jgi:outer membrane murein-binding lipoprotein Lpp